LFLPFYHKSSQSDAFFIFNSFGPHSELGTGATFAPADCAFRRRERLRTLETVPSLLVVVKANPKEDSRERESERHAHGVREKTRRELRRNSHQSFLVCRSSRLPTPYGRALGVLGTNDGGTGALGETVGGEEARGASRGSSVRSEEAV